MPNPKDPIKLLEYRTKLSVIAKQRGFGKWMVGKTSPMKGKHHSEETKKIIREKGIIIAKERGFGKWMKGKHLSSETKIKIGNRTRGRTYEEMYGSKKAMIIRQKNISTNKSGWIEGLKKVNPLSITAFKRVNDFRTNKTYKQIYGEDRAFLEAKKRSDSNKARWVGKVKCYNETNPKRFIVMHFFEYKNWRNAVFERDNYCCQKCNKNGWICAHHIKEWSKYPELRYDVTNGITLCKECHKLIHSQQRINLMGGLMDIIEIKNYSNLTGVEE